MSKYSLDSYRGIIAVSFPIIIGMAGRTLMMFFDRLFLANHSQLELQAALPAGILSFTLMCIMYGIVSYTSTFVAQYYGANNYEGCSKSLAQGLFLTIFSIPIFILITFLGLQLLSLSGHTIEVLKLEKIYFTILMFSASGPIFTVAASSFWNGRGKTVRTMVAVLIGSIINIGLDYLLIFGKFGFPEMGIKGAAIATAIASFIPGIILTVAAYSGKTAFKYKTRELFSFSWPLTKRILKFGFPAGLHLFMDVASFTVFIFIAGRLTPLEFTANNIAFSVNNLAFNPLLGFGFATTVIVGRSIGMGGLSKAVRATRRTLFLALAYFVPVALTFVLFPDFYTHLFFSSESSVSIEQLTIITAKLLTIVAVWGIFDATNLIFAGALRGAGDTKFVLITSALLAWFFWIPGVLYLYAVRDAGIVALWLFTSIYVAIFATIFLFRFRAGHWKKIDLLGMSK